MKLPSRLILLIASFIHLLLLAGWRWQHPLVPYFFDATVLSGGRGLDFYSIYQAGYNARQGADVYEGDASKVDIVVPYFTPFRYLPIVAYSLGAVLSLFNSLTAYKVWVVVVELTLWLCVLITYRRTRDPDRFARLALMWLCFTPYYLELFMGQFSFIQAALIFGMLVAVGPHPPPIPPDTLTDDAQGAAKMRLLDGLWLASVLWKINTLVFAPVLLRLRRFGVLVIAAVVVALTTVPYFLLFPAHLRDFLLNNFGNSLTGHELGNLGFRQLVFESLAALGASPDLQRVIQLVVVALILGLCLGMTLLYPGSHVRRQTSDLLSLWLVAFFLVSPQIWEHHFVMLLPVLVGAYSRRPGWLVFLIWLLLAIPTPFGFIGLQTVIAANHDLRAFAIEPIWQVVLQHASKSVPALCLFGYVLWELLQASRTALFRGQIR